MKIAILGTGGVGRTLAVKLASENHEVIMGTRNVSETLSRSSKDAMGNPSFSEWYKNNASIKIDTFSKSSEFAELIFIATFGNVSLNVIDEAGKNNFANKIVIDTTNPLDFSKGVPPAFTATLGNSLGERIQNHIPEAKVIKAFNTIGAHIMVNAKREEGTPDLFIAGNDNGSKEVFKKLISTWGWGDIIDLGDISQAYWLEAFAMLWINFGFKYNNWTHAFKLLKK